MAACESERASNNDIAPIAVLSLLHCLAASRMDAQHQQQQQQHHPSVDLLNDESCIKFSLGNKDRGHGDGELNCPTSFVFDQEHDRFYVADGGNHRVQAFSTDDGSLESMFGSYGSQAGLFNWPWGLAIDHERDRIFVVDAYNHRVQALSRGSHSFLFELGNGACTFEYPTGIAIDETHGRIVVVDTYQHRLQFFSIDDGSFLFNVGVSGTLVGQFRYPVGLAVDCVRDRLIVADSDTHRIQVLSSVDGAFLFEFGKCGRRECEFNRPRGLCVDHLGRIIVADSENQRLQAFTPQGDFIATLECPAYTVGVSFDERRGLIAFATAHRVHVIAANRWLPHSFVWKPDRHRYAPHDIRQEVLTMTMIRSLVHESSVSLLPNELLFEIFAML